MKRQTVPTWIKNMLPKKCCNCGSTEHLIYHHIIPWEVGGNNIPSNIAVVCAECHGKVHFGDTGYICHGDLIRDGQQKAKARGVHIGRKPKEQETVFRTIAKYSTQFNNVYDLAFDMRTEKEIMEMLNLKPTCYSKYKRMLIDEINKDVWEFDWPKPKIHRSMPLYEHCVIELRNKRIQDVNAPLAQMECGD